jgi:hypothetical protein
MEPSQGARIPEITALDWSSQKRASSVPGGWAFDDQSELRALAGTLPDLREADFSRTRVLGAETLYNLSWSCRLPEKVTCHERWCCLNI